MSNAGSDILPGDGGTPLVDSSVPYATVNRRERSRKLAQRRRDTYKSIMDELIGVSMYHTYIDGTKNDKPHQVINLHNIN